MSLKFSNLIGECLTAPLMTKKEPMNIHFQDITCTVPIQCNKFWNKEQKHILKNVSGDFQDRKLTAIIGPSGSGKTTLLDIISGYRIKNVSGYVYVNGEQRNIKKLIKQSCYVMQNDTLQSLVTVQEEMAFVINLKLDVNVTLDYKEILILEILKKFSLIEYKNTLIKNLSLDDRRKLAIALELISDPPILFLDEPTNGMDTKSAKEYFEILKKLTLEGRTVVCSIRHPNTSLLNFFNNAYFLYEGRCIYQGTVHNLIPYLFANNFECPLHNDSVEYVMEICSTDKSNHAENLSAAITNGKSQEWLDCPTCWSTIPLNTLNIRHIQRNEIEDSFQYTRSFKHQLYFLLKMISLTLARNRLLTRTIFITNVCIALFFAMFFNGIGNNAALVRINYNLLFLCLAEVMYINLISKIITFYIEMPVIKKEYLSGWYSLKAYFVASALIDVPTQTFFVIIFSSIVYYFTDQSLEIYRFTQFVIIMVLFGLLFQDYGMCVATFINTKFQNAILFAIYSTFPWMIFCGIFINYQDTSFLFKWFFKMSVFHRALEAVTTVTYGYNRKSLICFKSFCYFKNPHTFVKKLDMDCDSFIFDFVYLLVVYVIIKFCCYSALKYKILHPK